MCERCRQHAPQYTHTITHTHQTVPIQVPPRDAVKGVHIEGEVAVHAGSLSQGRRHFPQAIGGGPIGAVRGGKRGEAEIVDAGAEGGV